MLKWIFIVFTVFSSSAGDILCASGMSTGHEVDLGSRGVMRAVRYVLTRKRVILGGLCYAAAFFSLLGLLSVAKLSVAIPATALSFVVDTLGARFILQEHVPWKRWAGVLCVCAGVALAVSPVGTAKPLAGAAAASAAPVQTHKDEARDHQARAEGLHDQSAPAEVLAEP